MAVDMLLWTLFMQDIRKGKNMTKKKILGSIGFLLILAALLLGSSFLLKSDKDIDNVVAFERKQNDLNKEKENSIDVAFFGDSESYSAFIPLKMWNDEGFTSYICGTSLQRLCDSYALIQEVYSRQKPGVVVIETNCLFRTASSQKEESSNVDRLYAKIFPILKYHTRWKAYLDVEGGTGKDHDKERKMKGFKYRTGIEPYMKGPWMHKTSESEKLGNQVEEYLCKIKDYVTSKGGELLLVSVPSPTNWSTQKHNATSELADRLGLDFIDMNHDADEIGIDWSIDTKDGGNHLNFEGAFKLTEYFEKILISKYNLPNHKNDSYYSDWNEALKNSKINYDKIKKG